MKSRAINRDALISKWNCCNTARLKKMALECNTKRSEHALAEITMCRRISGKTGDQIMMSSRHFTRKK